MRGDNVDIILFAQRLLFLGRTVSCDPLNPSSIVMENTFVQVELLPGARIAPSNNNNLFAI